MPKKFDLDPGCRMKNADTVSLVPGTEATTSMVPIFVPSEAIEIVKIQFFFLPQRIDGERNFAKEVARIEPSFWRNKIHFSVQMDKVPHCKPTFDFKDAQVLLISKEIHFKPMAIS